MKSNWNPWNGIVTSGTKACSPACHKLYYMGSTSENGTARARRGRWTWLHQHVVSIIFCKAFIVALLSRVYVRHLSTAIWKTQTLASDWMASFAGLATRGLNLLLSALRALADNLVPEVPLLPPFPPLPPFLLFLPFLLF